MRGPMSLILVVSLSSVSFGAPDFDSWKRKGKRPTQTQTGYTGYIEKAKKELGQELEQELDKVRQLLKDDPEAAYSHLMLVLSYANEVVSVNPWIIDKLLEFVKEIREIIAEIAEKLGVASFSIEAGVPWGVSVSLSWNTQ